MTKDKNTQILKTTLSVLSIVIAFFALYATWQQMKASERQMKLSERAYQAQAWQIVNSHVIDIDKIFIDKPYLRPYFFSKKLIDQKDNKYQEVMAMSDMYFDFVEVFDDDYIQELPGMGENGEYWPIWKKYFEDQFSLSPALCIRYQEIKDWYTSTGLVAKSAEKGCKSNIAKK